MRNNTNDIECYESRSIIRVRDDAFTIQDFNYSIDPLKGVLNSRIDNTRNILETKSKTDAGILEYNVPGKPYAIGTQTSNPGSVPERVQDITYTGFQRPSTIEENSYKATFTYGPDYARSKMEIRNNSALQSTRYYLGSCYEKDVPASGSTTERLYIGGNAYNAPAVYIRTGSGTWTLHYIHRDHLGSITAITNSSGSRIAEYSFDPWGRQRNPVNQVAYAPDAAPSLLLGRGYTGHEHLPMFGLINMNARLYDPVLGRFLSPDPYVQAPNWSQSFNRYAYCVNNPLMNVDIDGEKWWHWLLGISLLDPVSAITTATVTAGSAATTAGVTVASATATALMAAGTATSIDQAVTYVGSFFKGPEWGGKRFNNSLRILGGLFKTDENKNFWQNSGMLLSRWTWEGIQTWSGYAYSRFRNAAGNVDRVDYFGGATFATNENASGSWGMSIGNYINTNIDHEITGNFDDYVLSHPLYMHEYGHTIDSRAFGLSYLFAIGVPSIISASGSTWQNDKNYSTHDEYWTEIRANRRAAKYFKKYYNIDWSGDKFTTYPL